MAFPGSNCDSETTFIDKYGVKFTEKAVRFNFWHKGSHKNIDFMLPNPPTYEANVNKVEIISRPSRRQIIILRPLSYVN